MPSVAIVGFSNNTFDLCKGTKADEIWTMNHAYLVTDIPRIDRLYEIHKKKWFSRKESKKAPEYIKWLAKVHPFPIVMQQALKSVPSSVTYPFNEIVSTLLPNLNWVDGKSKRVNREKYFTSSFAYMLAQAIYEGYNPIEIYGVEMDGDTEYGYQRPNAEFWIGIALGRGLEVILPEDCHLCYAPLYGYQGVPYIDADDVKAIMMEYQEREQQLKDESDAMGKLLKSSPDNLEYNEQYKNLTAMLHTYQGAAFAAARLIMESDHYISRQFLELKRAKYINGTEYYKGLVNVRNTELHNLREAGQDTTKAWEEYADTRASMYANMGANQLLKKLMLKIDFRPVEFDLVMEIIED